MSKLLTNMKSFFEGRPPPEGPLPSETSYARDIAEEVAREQRHEELRASRRAKKEAKKAKKAAAKAAAASLPPPPPPKSAPLYQLTPLSEVLAQSSKDIATLRASNRGNAGMATPSAAHDVSQETVDFEALEERLGAFESVYDEFTNGGDPKLEVYVVTRQARASELTGERMGTAESVPKMKRPDCAL